MRAVFVGAGPLTLSATRLLLQRGHEVVIIDQDKERIDALSEELDCGFIHGDGSKPAILREADPAQTDFLFCLTSNDQANILASLVGRSLGFANVFTKIEDLEFEHICLELGLEQTIVLSRNMGQLLADTVQGIARGDISGIIKEEARLFTFLAKEDLGPVGKLELPRRSRVICLYRNERFVPVDGDTQVKENDEVVIITHSAEVTTLHHLFANHPQGRKSP